MMMRDDISSRASSSSCGRAVIAVMRAMRVIPRCAREERLARVDARNVVVGDAPRSETVRARGLGRGAFGVVLRRARGRDGSWDALVTRRSMMKDVWPGALDAVTSGACLGGEEYAETMRRELAEELGEDAARGARVEMLFTFPYEDRYMRVWGGCFEVTLRDDAEVVCADGEVAAAAFEPLDALAESLREGREEFTPVGKYALERYLAFKASGGRELPPQTWSERHVEASG